MARIRKALDDRSQGDKGFTLIELLVVIIIIGILAAIAIPAFLNQRQKAWASQVESDLKNAAIAAESYAVDNNGAYNGGTAPANLGTAVSTNGVVTAGSGWDLNGFNGTSGVTVTAAVNASDFTLTGRHTSRPGTWTYTSADGRITFAAGATPTP